MEVSDILDPVSAGLGFITDMANFFEQKKVNKQNYEMAQQQFQYQKDLQNRIFEREDNAVQRKMADLKAAGLSPTLAAGDGASSGAVVSTSAPQQDFTPLGVGNTLDALNASLSAQSTLASVNNVKQDTALKAAQVAQTDALTFKQNIDNNFEESMKLALLNQVLADTKVKDKNYDVLEKQREYLAKTLDQRISLVDQQVLAGNQQNWRQGYDNYFLQHYGFAPSMQSNTNLLLYKELKDALGEGPLAFPEALPDYYTAESGVNYYRNRSSDHEGVTTQSDSHGTTGSW